MQILQYLMNFQSTLKHIKTSLGTSWDHAYDVYRLPDDLRALDLCVSGSHKMGLLDLALLQRSTKLKRIAIKATKDGTRSVQEHFTNAIRQKSLAFPELEELSLNGLSFKEGENLAPWRRMIRSMTLKRLTIWNCPGADDLVFRMTKSMPDNVLNFRHLAIESEQGGAGLLGMLNACKPLTSLHVRINVLPNFQEFSRRLEKHVHSLHTLALHELHNTTNDSYGANSEVYSLFRKCGKARYLGIQLHRLDFNVDGWDPETIYPQFLASFARMEDLRLVHFRFPRTGSTDTEEAEFERNPAHIAWMMQRFCNAVFEHMESNRLCPSLTAIVVGVHFDPTGLPSYLDYDGTWYFTRHCFIRGYQTDALNRRTVVGVPVPASKILELEPDCDLLDYDPECDWVGGLRR
jgi:hypothetical protein